MHLQHHLLQDLKKMEHSYYDNGMEPQEYMVPLSRGDGQHPRNNTDFYQYAGSSGQGIHMHPKRTGRTPPTMYGGSALSMEGGGIYRGDDGSAISRNVPARSLVSIDLIGSPNLPSSAARSESQYSNEKQSSDFSQDGEIEPIVLWNITLPLGLSR